MQIISKISDNAIFDDFKYFFNPEEVCFFDIETTGFAADYTKLYLIGCCYIRDNRLHMLQWFNDDGNSEACMLADFMKFISNYKYLLNYNGDGFDIPYLEKKCKKNSIDSTITNLISVDLYKKLKPFKNILHIDNLKLKTAEQFLGIHRQDRYSGGELIAIYNTHLQQPSKEACATLLLHNYEDIENLVSCFALLSLDHLLTGNFTLQNISVKNEHLCFALTLPTCIPKRSICSYNEIVVSIHKTNVTVSVPIIEDTFRMFYDNPSEYYYLPEEDIAIHKSVAVYVDKNRRTKATRENCYCNTEGSFITQLEGTLTPAYKKGYQDKTSYILLVDTFLENQNLLHDYVAHMLKQIIAKL